MKLTVIITFLFSLFFSSVWAQNTQERERYTLERVYFEIVKAPGRVGNGRISIYPPEADGDGKCNSCVERFAFDNNIKAQAGGDLVSMNLADLAALSDQLVDVVVDKDKVVIISFSGSLRNPNASSGL